MTAPLRPPAQARKGMAVDLYRKYFKRLHGWVKPGSYFAFHAILSDKVPRTRKDLEPFSISLCHGSLLVMSGPTQHCWKHCVPKTRKSVAPRVNLTFRRVEGATSEGESGGG